VQFGIQSFPTVPSVFLLYKYMCVYYMYIRVYYYYYLIGGKKKRVRTSYMDANLIQMPPQVPRYGRASLPVLWRCWLGSMLANMIGGEKKLGMAIPYLIYVAHVELCCAVSLLRFRCYGDGDHALLSEL
jgi:hypothetical protein